MSAGGEVVVLCVSADGEEMKRRVSAGGGGVEVLCVSSW